MLDEYTTWLVARVFFDEPAKAHSLREIARKAGIAHTALKSHINVLRRNGVIAEKREKIGKRIWPIYKAAFESDSYKLYRKLDMIYRLHSSGFVSYLERTYQPDCIVLFGSAARGEDAEDSDIDIFLQASDREVALSRFESALKRKIQLHIKPRFRQYPDELRNNIANGIVLYGFLEALP